MSSTTNSSNNAAAAIDSTALCAKYETKSEISADYLDVESSPQYGGPSVMVGDGSDTWGPVMTCIAQKLQMPTSVEAELKSGIAQSISAIKGQTSFFNLPTINTSWNLSNGGKIYLGFSGPADSVGAWTASFGITTQP